MEKINGKLALMLLVEEREGYQDFTETELRDLRKKAKSLFLYLAKKHNSIEKAQFIFDRIEQDTVKELSMEWCDVFRVHEIRLWKDFAAECDTQADAAHDDVELLDILEDSDVEWEEHITKLACVHAEKPDWDRWKRALERLEPFDEILEIFERIKEHQGGLNPPEIRNIRRLANKLNALRFGISKGYKFKETKSLYGDGIYIGFKMWADRRNRINALLGISKRYVPKEKEPVAEEDDLKGRWEERMEEEEPLGDDLWYEMTIHGKDIDYVGRVWENQYESSSSTTDF